MADLDGALILRRRAQYDDRVRGLFSIFAEFLQVIDDKRHRQATRRTRVL